ncbi:MAG: glycine cleavage system aminomethyltransferase GcvT [Candidatus Cryptobacteroides sp.]|jgi:aminomethyltransferase
MEEQLKFTCLHDFHLALGAKMSPFAGYDMPIQYTSITEEHRAVRADVGIFDVSHMGEIFISGPDSEKFVNYIFTNDVSTLEAGQILYGMMLYPDGGTVDDLLVYKGYIEGNFLLVVNAANTEKDYAWILQHAEGFDVKIVNDSDNWGQIAVQGPNAEEAVTKALGFAVASKLDFYTFMNVHIADRTMFISRTGYTGEDGFEIYADPAWIREIWNTLLEDNVTPCGLGCRDTLRFEAGLPLYGHELSPEISPVMAGLSIFCKLGKEEFLGKEAIAAQKAEGVERKVVGIELQDNAVPRAGYPVELEDGTEVGVVTTGYRSISLGKSLCFALVKKEYAALGSSLLIRIRKHTFPGIVVKKRFYQTNYKK